MEVYMISDTLPWSNVGPSRSCFTTKWINGKFKNWSLNSIQVLDQSKRSCKVWQFTFASQILDRSPVELEVQSILPILKYAVLWNLRSLKFFLVAIADLARGMVGQLISSCWRADKCAKDWMSKNKSKNKNKTNQTKKQHHPQTRMSKWNASSLLQKSVIQ